ALVQQRHDLLAGERLAEGGEVTEVAEEDGHLAALARRSSFAAFLDPRGDLGGEVAGEPLPAEMFARDALDQPNGAAARLGAEEGHHGRDEDGEEEQRDVESTLRGEQRLEASGDRGGEVDVPVLERERREE